MGFIAGCGDGSLIGRVSSLCYTSSPLQTEFMDTYLAII